MHHVSISGWCYILLFETCAFTNGHASFEYVRWPGIIYPIGRCCKYILFVVSSQSLIQLICYNMILIVIRLYSHGSSPLQSPAPQSRHLITDPPKHHLGNDVEAKHLGSLEIFTPKWSRTNCHKWMVDGSFILAFPNELPTGNDFILRKLLEFAIANQIVKNNQCHILGKSVHFSFPEQMD